MTLMNRILLNVPVSTALRLPPLAPSTRPASPCAVSNSQDASGLVPLPSSRALSIKEYGAREGVPVLFYTAGQAPRYREGFCKTTYSSSASASKVAISKA